MTSRSAYDAIVVGGGHNGLVAAFYLAEAGSRVLVLERRERVGGPVATVEFFPGYRSAMTNSPGSLEPKIVHDMALESHGLRWIKPDPAVVMPFPDGRFFVGWRDQNKTREMLRRFSARDAEAYARVFAFFDDFARRIGVSVFEPPPSYAELAARLKTPQDEADFATIFFGSIRDFLDRRLESDEVKAAIAMLSTGGAVSPSTPGSPLQLLLRPMSLASSRAQGTHDPRTQPLRGSTGLPYGGMGSIIDAMEAAIRAKGVTILTNAAVEAIRVGADGAVKGVALANGDEYTAPVVLSNLDPRTTLLDKVEAGFVDDAMCDALRAIPKGAATFKVVVAADTPPLFAGVPADDAVAYGTCQIRYAPSMDYLEQCHRDFVAGRRTDCPRLFGLIPTFSDPSQAPEGKHLLSFNAWFFPSELREGSWASERDAMGNRIVQILTDMMPSLKQSIVATRFWSPDDLEDEYGLIGGNFSHMDMTPAHMFGLRPLAGLSDYRTPVRGLYLCGSGVWPGGTVTGLPGHNASMAVLRDLQRDRRDERSAVAS